MIPPLLERIRCSTLPTLAAVPHEPEPLALPLSALSELGEGPVWDTRRERLYWVDIVRGNLHWLDRDAKKRNTLELPPPLGFVALTDDPGILVAGVGASLAYVEIASGRLDVFAPLEPAETPLRCNDGKCDPTGRLWAGTMPTGGDGKPLGTLFSLQPGGSPQRVLRDVGCSNGLAWNVARREFTFIDSLTRRIDRFRWDPFSGQIDERSVLASFGEDPSLPDGMCIDAEGHLWVAFWDGGCVRRIHGVTGTTLATISLPAQRVTSCTFGGPDLSTLYITTAHQGFSSAERAGQPLAGSLFSVQPGVRGLPADVFVRPPLPR